MPAIKSAKTAAAKQAKELKARPVIYPTPDCRLFDAEKPLTVQEAKDYLGWEEETEEIKFGKDFLFKDKNGKKIRLHNNPNNRPFYMREACEPIIRTLLYRADWKLNGETIIIGKTGLVENGQHQLVALVLAEQVRTGEDGAKWRKFWKDEPITLQKFVVTGIDEDQATIDTMDTCKPRSLADVLYRSGYFANLDMAKREQISKVMERALKFAWKRTGHFMRNNVWLDTVRTHPESMDWLKRHPKLVEAVKFVYDENQPDKTGREPGEALPPPKIAFRNSVGLGVAATLYYLMGCSATERDDYYTSEAPSDKKLNWSNWDKATEFWTLFANNEKTLRPIREALASIVGADGEGKVAPAIACAVLINAWNQWVDGGKLTVKNITPKLVQNPEDQSWKLAEKPVIGGEGKGIDLGESKNDHYGDDDEEEEATEEEVESTKEEIQSEAAMAAVSANGDGETTDENG